MIISFSIILVTLIIQYWNISFNVALEISITPSMIISRILNQYVCWIFLALLIYEFMVARKLGNFIVSIDLDFKTNLRPVLYTVEDILKMSILFFVLLKLSNDLVVCL